MTLMAPLGSKRPDPRPLGRPFFPCPHGRIPHLLKVIDTGLAFVQASKLGLVPETVRFHGAFAMEMLVYELGASFASIVSTPNHLQQPHHDA